MWAARRCVYIGTDPAVGWLEPCGKGEALLYSYTSVCASCLFSSRTVLMYFDLWQTTGTFWNCPFSFVPWTVVCFGDRNIPSLYALTDQSPSCCVPLKFTEPFVWNQRESAPTRVGPDWPECLFTLVITCAIVGSRWRKHKEVRRFLHRSKY
jgi:hypothetical protein